MKNVRERAVELTDVVKRATRSMLRSVRSSRPAASPSISAYAATRRTCAPVSASFASIALRSVSKWPH